MSELVEVATALWTEMLFAYGLVFLRVGAAMALLPAFGERSIPIRVRLGLSLVLTAVIAPALAGRLPEPGDLAGWLAAGGAEVLAGLAIGIVLRLMILVLQVAGTIAANVTSLSQILGGASVDPQPAMAHIMVVGGLALAAMAGLHVKVVHSLLLSYEMFPPGQFVDRGQLADWGVAWVGDSFALAFALSAPFVVVSMLYNLALGVINRAMPQLMVAFVGAPAITALGLVLMALAVPGLLMIWLAAFDRALWALDGF